MKLDYSRVRTFIRRLKIRDKAKRLVPFHPNPCQDRFLDLLEKMQDEHRPPRIIIDKSRRVGISTICMGLLTAQCCGAEAMEARVLAHLSDTSRILLDMAKGMHQSISLPADWRRSKVILFDEDEVNASKMTVQTAKTTGGGRGGGFTSILASESAYYEKEGSFLALLPTLPREDNFFCFIESTANGREGTGEDFYQTFLAAHRKESEFEAFFVPWFEDPLCVADPEILRKPTDDDNAKEEKELRAKYHLTEQQMAWRRLAYMNEAEGLLVKLHQEFPCLIGDTNISTQRGIVPLNQILVGDVTESGVVADMRATGLKPIYRVLTDMGYEVVGTADHPVPVGEQLVALADLKNQRVGLRPFRFADTECVIDSGGQEIRITEDYARFLGIFLGDGSYGRMPHSTISIACDVKDEDVVVEVERLIDQIFGRHHTRTVGKNQGCREVRVHVRAFRQTMQALDIYSADSPHRRLCVPPCIFRSPQPVVREFLRGIFETDGFNCKRYNRVSLFSKNVEFLADVQRLLLGFGITCRRRSRMTTKTFAGVKGQYQESTLELRAQEAMLFHEQIGFISERKANRHRSIDMRYGQQRIPLRLYDTVVSVEPAGEAQVFDLSIDDPAHCFSANGILVHNCSWEESFIASDNPTFQKDEIEIAEKGVRPPKYRAMLNRTVDGRIEMSGRGPFKMWETPQPGHEYYLGADAARGTLHGDFASATVWNGTTGHQAAAYQERANVDEFANHLDLLGRYFNNALMTPETSCNLGNTVMQRLQKDFKYPRWYYWKGRDDRLRPGTSNRPSIGFETTSRTRHMLMHHFRISLRDGECIPHDEEFVSQMKLATTMFGMRWDVIFGHDDVLMSGTVGWLARIQWPPRKVIPQGGKLELPDEFGTPEKMTDVGPIAAEHQRKVLARMNPSSQWREGQAN